MKEETNIFMELVQPNIGNEWQPLYEDTQYEAIYYKEFEDDIKDDDNILTYGYEILDYK